MVRAKSFTGCRQNELWSTYLQIFNPQLIEQRRPEKCKVFKNAKLSCQIFTPANDGIPKNTPKVRNSGFFCAPVRACVCVCLYVCVCLCVVHKAAVRFFSQYIGVPWPYLRPNCKAGAQCPKRPPPPMALMRGIQRRPHSSEIDAPEGPTLPSPSNSF